MYDIDIVTSAKNEEQNLDQLYSRLDKVMRAEKLRWQLIISDNDSRDETWKIISNLARKKRNVVGLRMSRDFGFENSIKAGLDLSFSPIAIIMASDLQDAPEDIPILLQKYRQGFDHVYQVVTDRPGVPRLRVINTWIFYKIASFLSRGIIRENVGDFRLISREVVEYMSHFPERNRFFRAMVNYAGSNSIGVEIPRKQRMNGKSKTSLQYALSLAFRGIILNASGLLDLASAINLILGISLSFIGIASAVVLLVISHSIPFITSLSLLLCIFLGIIIITLGILSKFISLIFDEVRARPLYYIREKITYTEITG